MAPPADPSLLRRNRLLALLDDRVLAALAAQMSFVPMEVGESVMSQGRAIRHAWFPVEGVISMLAATQERGGRVEVGTIGKEGMAGVQLLLGRAHAQGDCFVQVVGQAWRMPAAAFQDAARTFPALADTVLRYAHTLLVQASQGCACNLTHSPLQRCARWLLMTHDRVNGDTFVLTQEYLGHMLGERRPTVSKVASTLKRRRLIAYSRGRITVVDREGLEDAACPCYRFIRDGYERVMGEGGRR